MQSLLKPETGNREKLSRISLHRLHFLEPGAAALLFARIEFVHAGVV